ncbi:MAG: hypothetical protein K2Q97_13615 [Burkholderiaceae bacterium]|nr:hypothetical protein [Burkholderiaceae bacterium]
MNSQAKDLVQAVAVFKLGNDGGYVTAAKSTGATRSAVARPAGKSVTGSPQRTAPMKPALSHRPAAKPIATAKADTADDWESF